MKNELTIITKDFYHLGATEYRPYAPKGQSVVINSAMAVKQQYYSDFASYLADEGFHVITYDYRGIGRSKKGSLRKLSANLLDWAGLDYEAVLQYARETYPKNKVSVLGHSIGGQLVGLSTKSEVVDRFVFIASQTPYWRNYKASTKPKLWTLWYVLIPGLSRMFGYFPASSLGLFENLPKNVALQWMRWARSKEYAFSEIQKEKTSFARLTQPCLALSFADDPYAPELATKDLLSFYDSLNTHHQHLDPEDIAMDSIGHFGFFRKRFKNTLWLSTKDWLEKKGSGHRIAV